MIKKFNKFFFVITLSIVFSGFLAYIFPETELAIEENRLKSSGSWQIGSGIYIDDSNVNNDWQKTATDNDWCSGTGMWSDPYVIENVTINGYQGGSAIFIENSNVYFIIKNCVLINNRGGNHNYDSSIRLNNVQNGRILNNDCSLNEGMGVYMRASSNNTISHNIIVNNTRTGIYIGYESNNNTILYNTFNYNDDGGIYIFQSNYNNFTGNEITQKKVSVSDDSRREIELTGEGNLFSGNKFNNSGIHLRSGSLGGLSSHKIDITNLVNGNPIIYYINTDNLMKENFSNAGQVILVGCDNAEISGLDLSYSGPGISLYHCSYNNVFNNTLSFLNREHIYLYSSHYNNVSFNIINHLGFSNGISLRDSYYNNITSNQIDKCFTGIDLSSSYWNTINKNSVNENYQGIKIYNGAISDMYNIIKENNITNNNNGVNIHSAYSNSNTFYLNLFINNEQSCTEHAGQNYWDNGSIGNYWSDYLGLDADDDGIGDTPYYITGPAGSRDNFPIILNIPPKIEIITPFSNQSFYSEAPQFNITVYDANLEEIWYTINGGLNNKSITEMSGTINQMLWDSLPLGIIIIKFYANDTRGNIAHEEVSVSKKAPQPPPTPAIPGYNLAFLLGILSIILIFKIKILKTSKK